MYAHRGNALAEILSTYKRAEQKQRARAHSAQPTPRATPPAHQSRRAGRVAAKHR
jgi:hypothetical protein